MKGMSNTWAAKEFSDIDLGDPRLNNRLMKMAHEFSNHPEFSINQASSDWHAAKAAYRFFQNDKFSADDILKPHIKATSKRCENHKCVLVVQDTSVIGYSHHPETKGLGSIGGHSDPIGKVHGLYMHTALAMTTEGMPLGLLSNDMWSRTKTRDQAEKRMDHMIHTEDKESYKWIAALEKSFESLNQKTQVITIADREGDIFDFYLSALDMKTNVIVRCRDDRDVGTRSEPLLLSQKLSQAPPYKQTRKIKIPIEEVGNKNNKKSTKYREAELEIRSVPIVLTPSRKAHQVVKEKIPLWAVEAKEINPPEGLEKAHWVLITTLPIESFEEALMIIHFYSLRLRIENYFRVLKSGCTVEKCRLSESERLIKYITLFSVIAWRLFWLTYVKRVEPKASSETVLTEKEWKTLFFYFNKTNQLPETPPTVDQALVWLARLGGFLNRKNDGEPGPTALWRGWSRLQDMVAISEITMNFK